MLASRSLTSLQAAEKAAGKARTRLSGASQRAGTRLQAICDELSRKAEPELSAIVDAAESGKLDLLRDRGRRMETLAAALDRLAGGVRELADTVAAAWAAQAGKGFETAGKKLSEQTRMEKVAAAFGRLRADELDDPPNDAELLLYRFDAGVWPCEADEVSAKSPGGDQTLRQTTDLSKALERVTGDAGGRRLAAVFLFSDGAHNGPNDPAKRAAALSGVPIYTVPIGSVESHRDVLLHHVNAPRTVLKNDRIVIDGRIDAHHCAGEKLTISLMAGESVLDRHEVTVPSITFFHKFQFTHKARDLGKQEYRVQVAPLAEERRKDNNDAKLQVEVVEGTMRVLLVDELPRWEFRYLRNLFDRDERVECKPLLFRPQRKGGEPAQGDRWPRTLDDWAAYRIVILGDVSAALLTPARQRMLEQYVNRRGGDLIVIAGANYLPEQFTAGPLGALLPVQVTRRATACPEGYDLYLTAAGRACPALELEDDRSTGREAGQARAEASIWRKLTRPMPLYGLSDYCLPKPTATVLLGAAPRTGGSRRRGGPAFLSWHYYGKGRVVYIAAPMTYRLRYRTGDLHHHRFWGQLLRWTVSQDVGGGSKTVHLAVDKARCTKGDDVQVTLHLREPSKRPIAGGSCRVLVYKKDSLVASVALKEDENEVGTYRATLKGLDSGQYVLRADGPAVTRLLAAEDKRSPVQTRVTVEPPLSPELREVRCNLPLLKKIADSSGGMILPPTGVAHLLRQLDLSPDVAETVSRRPLWTRWTLLWVFLGCLTMEWIVRKLSGMA